MIDGLTFRQDYFAEPGGWQGLANLLQDTFHIDIRAVDGLGGMDGSAMPFGWFDDEGQLVANLSAFSMPMMINGQKRKVAGLQSGAVRPQWRGKGLFRDLMRRTFAWVDEQGFELSVLYTDKPEMYEPYGFRTVPMHKFEGPAPKAGALTPSRPLSMDSSTDTARLFTLINNRAATSMSFSPLGHPAMFMVNSAWDCSIFLTDLDDLNAVVAWRMGGDGAFQLLDVVGRTIPSLAEILGALEVQAHSVECFFPTDNLNWKGTSVIDGNRLPFMVRGDLSLLPSEPFALTPMADF